MRRHLKERVPNRRWFPGQRVGGNRSGWLLANAEHWDEAGTYAIDLASLVIHRPSTMRLSFIILETDTTWTLEFDGLSELQVDGDLQIGRNENGWEVLDIGLSMLIADLPRDDERLVYLMELPSAVICFASFPPSLVWEQLQAAERAGQEDSQ